MKRTVTSKILTGLLAILMVFAMIPVTTEAVFAGDEIPLLTIVMVPGVGEGPRITVTSQDEGLLDEFNKESYGHFSIDWQDASKVWYRCQGKPDSFTGPPGATFAGWLEYDQASFPLEEGTFLSGYNGDTKTLIAAWSYTVSFDPKNNTSIETQTVIHGRSVSQPEEPEREGWDFEYWYAGSDTNTPYNFNDAVTGNLQLTALWVKEMKARVLDLSNPELSAGSTDCGTIDVKTVVSSFDYNDTKWVYYLPEGPVTFTAKPKEGYHFVGWYEGYDTISDTPLTMNPEFTTNVGGDVVKVTAAFEPTTSTTTKKDNEVEPTCTQPGGYDEVEYCTTCGTEISRTHVEIPVKDHVWDSVYTVDKAATETAAGSKSIHCKVCKAVKPGSVQTIAKLPPKEIRNLAAVKISKPSAGKKKVTVKWKKVSKKNQKKIQGIEIQVATDSKFLNIVKSTTAGKKKVSKTVKGLKSKRTYWVRIRAYKNASDGKHVSAWKVKKVKVK